MLRFKKWPTLNLKINICFKTNSKQRVTKLFVSANIKQNIGSILAILWTGVYNLQKRRACERGWNETMWRPAIYNRRYWIWNSLGLKRRRSSTTDYNWEKKVLTKLILLLHFIPISIPFLLSSRSCDVENWANSLLTFL